MSQSNRSWNNRPQTANTFTNAERMQELNTPLEPVPQFDLMKYLDSYKKSINFYNSYGLDKDNKKGGPQTGRPAYRVKTGEVDGKTTFWEM